MNELKRAEWCSVKANEEMFCVTTYSGYRSTRADPKGVRHVLAPDAIDETLGAAILDALAHSRFVLPAPVQGVWVHPEAGIDADLYDYESTSGRYSAWVAETMRMFGYKSKRAMFKDMKDCSVERSVGSITIEPSHHDELEGWSGDGISKEDYVVIAADSAPEVIGAALRLALTRCT